MVLTAWIQSCVNNYCLAFFQWRRMYPTELKNPDEQEEMIEKILNLRFEIQFKNEEKTYIPFKKTLKSAKIHDDYIKNYKWLTYDEKESH